MNEIIKELFNQLKETYGDKYEVLDSLARINQYPCMILTDFNEEKDEEYSCKEMQVKELIIDIDIYSNIQSNTEIFNVVNDINHTIIKTKNIIYNIISSSYYIDNINYLSNDIRAGQIKVVFKYIS